MTTNPTPEAEQELPPPSGDPIAPAAPVAPLAAAGTNAFAIAALICGLLGFTGIAAVLAIVFGVVALGQLKRRPQDGKGLAIAGIVLGGLSLVVWLVAIAALGSFFAERGENGEVTSAGVVLINDLREGDCFDGTEDGQSITLVTVRPCAEPHDGQVAAVADLEEGPFPGVDEARAMTEQVCMDLADPRIKDEVYDSVEFFTFSPDSAEAWDFDRSGLCVVTGLSGEKLTGTALTS